MLFVVFDAGHENRQSSIRLQKIWRAQATLKREPLMSATFLLAPTPAKMVPVMSMYLGKDKTFIHISYLLRPLRLLQSLMLFHAFFVYVVPAVSADAAPVFHNRYLTKAGT